ncbi:5-oxoprolinase subunit PxpA [Maribacter luteus]|uniref:5-oxoprolinase subunit PxpA n=1 Tax=Maribacter luteus TaxID=2594478 RepID=UPI0024930A2C|nr:5-oxoprolinase subunit PxpA [Maribacter luteus]
MEKFKIDINCDVGEGIGNEEAILPLISSCNIACGGHAGDKETMTRTVILAKEHKVLVGAHPSYPDTENFGRSTMAIDSDRLSLSIQNQIKGLQSILDHKQVTLHHIKAHGALYNDLAKDESLAENYLSAIKAYKPSVHLYVPPNSVIAELARDRGFSVKFEAFADRNYNEDLSLVSRKLPNAVINEPKAVLNHLARMVKQGMVVTLNGVECAMNADTYCLHGDTPNAFQILMYLSNELPKQQIYIKK